MCACWGGGCTWALPHAWTGPGAHASAFLGRLIQSNPLVLAELVNLGLAVIVSGAGQGAQREGTSNMWG